MGLHLTRGIAAAFNALLGVLLTGFWLSFLNGGFRGMFNRNDAPFVLILIGITVVSIVAATLLTLRRTVAQGVRWNFAVGGGWLVTTVIGASAIFEEGRINTWALSLTFAMATLCLTWLLLGVAVRQRLCLEECKQQAANNQSVTLSAEPAVVAPVSQTTSAPEAEPLVLGRR